MASDLEVIYDAGFTGNPLLPANIFYVDAINGDDTEGTGSFINPFLTLTAALAAAPNNSVIYLRNFVGTETPETVTITHTGLLIIGEGSSTVNPTVRFPGHIQFGAASSGIQLEDLTILGSTVGTPTIFDNSSLGGHNFRNLQVGHSDAGSLGWRVQAATLAGLQTVVQDCQFFNNITFDGTPPTGVIVAFRFSSIQAVLTVSHDNYVVPMIAVLNADLVHNAGTINWIGGAFAAGITSTATAPNGQLYLLEVSGNGNIPINKTGNCDYALRNVQHDPSTSVLTGTRVGYGAFAEDIGTVHTPVNYTATGQGLADHLAGIDTALAGGGGGGTPPYETTFSHTGNPSGTGDTYTITHNLGTEDVVVEVTWDEGGVIYRLSEYFYFSTNAYGWRVQNITANALDITLHDYQAGASGAQNVTVKVAPLQRPALEFYEEVINHTGSDTPGVFTITHNLNTMRVIVELDYENGGETARLMDAWSNGSNVYGWHLRNKTVNDFDLNVYNFTPIGALNATNNITVRVYKAA